MVSPKHHHRRLKTGEVIELLEVQPGRFVCPVCGFPDTPEPYNEAQAVDASGTPVGESFAVGSGERCPSCQTWFGETDFSSTGPLPARWRELRTAWLDRGGWPREEVEQIERNLGLSETQLKRDAAVIRTGTLKA